MEKQKSRIVWVDILKGYAMLFVLLHHLLESIPARGYSTFYAPFFLTAFFVTAGYTFSSTCFFPKFLLRKVKILLIPLFSLGMICILLSQFVSFNEQASFKQQIVELLVQDGTGGHRLWFVAAMFLACCMFYPISKLERKWFIMICVTLAALNIVIRKYFITTYLPWHLSVMGLACFWMGVGFYIKTYISKERTEIFFESKKILIGIVVLYGICLLIASVGLKATYLGFSDFIQYPIVYFALNGLGTGMMILISNLKYPRWLEQFLTFIGQNTLFYFAFHGKVQSILLVVANRIHIFPAIQTYSHMVVPVLAILEALLLVIPCIIFKKILPFAVGKDFEWGKKIIDRGNENESLSCK